MRGTFDTNSDVGDGIAFRDVVLAIALTFGLGLIIMLLLPHEPDKSTNESQHARGNIRVEVNWPDDYDVDIDTWGKAPGRPSVGYSNKSGVVLNLVRDDLGSYADITDRNYEVMFSRGLPKGEWVFNLHWYSNSGKKISVPVDVFVTITKDDSVGSKARPEQVISTTVNLTNVGQEYTIIRFELDEEGNLIRESMTSLHKPIRTRIGAAGGP